MLFMIEQWRQLGGGGGGGLGGRRPPPQDFQNIINFIGFVHAYQALVPFSHLFQMFASNMHQNEWFQV